MSCFLSILGEYVVKTGGIADELSSSGSALAEEEPSSLIDLPEFSLEEALQLVGLDEDSTEVSNMQSLNYYSGSGLRTERTVSKCDCNVQIIGTFVACLGCSQLISISHYVLILFHMKLMPVRVIVYYCCCCYDGDGDGSGGGCGCCGGDSDE